ncbi:phage holin [Psychrobacillus sp. Sa2BUA9]|uniref:Phage holin n=1 Tax=Psychrobacillus faecigallinarum TaxID=2762235 RepID=A0ABR8RAC7_9BACI|nr:phage holin [Psychrobacillus faecigallinarum]MBD7944695.1 phage holin [Psychrobacillus faecigallinarum]
MKLNWKVRFKNPVFIFQLVLSALIPLLASTGLRFEDLTTWSIVGDLILQAYSNPFLLFTMIVAVYATLNDPTTYGHSDSSQAMNYDIPKGGSKWSK